MSFAMYGHLYPERTLPFIRPEGSLRKERKRNRNTPVAVWQ